MSCRVAVPSLALVNGRDADGRRLDLRVVGHRIAAVGAAPRPNDRVLDLHGDRVLPGLINAHDHLQLNHFPPLGCSTPYRNVREWIDEVREKKRIDPALRAAASVALDERLLLGGIKNLLAGVTTVAHHDPLFASLRRADFPTHVVRRYGWSHSLFIDGPEEIRRAHAATPAGQPWIVHAGEGIDEHAAAELESLRELGVLASNTILVHALAFDSKQHELLARYGASVVWCPSSNLRLFGRTAHCDALIERGRVALGTDSRLSGARDLLEEIRIAHEVAGLDERTLESLVTAAPARMLRLAKHGALVPGAVADIVVLPSAIPLHRAARADVRLVIRSGAAQYGDIDAIDTLDPEAWSPVRVDDRCKALRSTLVTRLRASSLSEPGLTVSDEARLTVSNARSRLTQPRLS